VRQALHDRRPTDPAELRRLVRDTAATAAAQARADNPGADGPHIHFHAQTLAILWTPAGATLHHIAPDGTGEDVPAGEGRIISTWPVDDPPASCDLAQRTLYAQLGGSRTVAATLRLLATFYAAVAADLPYVSPSFQAGILLNGRPFWFQGPCSLVAQSTDAELAGLVVDLAYASGAARPDYPPQVGAPNRKERVA
jgi:hypothetical protein